MTTLQVESEVGKLRTVLVHQPGLEHRNTLPWNKDALLFDDIMDIEEARPEHRHFSALLALRGVEVLFLVDLLKDICRERTARERVYREVLGDEVLARVDPRRIAPQDLVAGVSASGPAGASWHVEPLPNMYFVRDSAFAVPGAAVVAHPYWPARQRESRIAGAILRLHPRFEGLSVYDGILNDPDATIEGGDVHIVDGRTVMVGVGERTNNAGADHLGRFLFQQTPVTRLLKLHIPANRVFMHLDTILTFVDRDQVLTMPYLWDRPDLYAAVARAAAAQCARLRSEYRGPSPGMLEQRSILEVVSARGVDAVFDHALEGLASLGLIDPDRTVLVSGAYGDFARPEDHIVEALREQWNDAANAFALKPGQVMGYASNDRTFRALEKAGVEVIQFRGSELVRGRGGARCMTMPLSREAA